MTKDLQQDEVIFFKDNLEFIVKILIRQPLFLFVNYYLG